MDWTIAKDMASHASALSRDALHVHAGVLGQLILAALLGRSLASPWPWLAVLAAALANEWWDLRYEIWTTRDDQYAASLHDMLNTMLLPTLLLLIARFAPGLLARRPSAGSRKRR